MEHAVYLKNLTVLANGEVVFVRTVVDLEADGYQSDLYLLSGGRETRLTTCGNVGLYTRLSGNRLLYSGLYREEDRVSAASGAPLSVFHILDLDTGRQTECLRLPLCVEQIAALGEQTYLFIASHGTGETVLDGEGALEVPTAKESAVFITEDLPFWRNGEGYCGSTCHTLYLYESGHVRVLTPVGQNVSGLQVFRDEYAVFIGQEQQTVPSPFSRLYRLALSDYSVQEILAGEDSFVYTHVMPSSLEEIIAVRSNTKTHGLYQDEVLDRIHMNTGDVSTLNGDSRYHLFNGICSDMALEGPSVIDVLPDGEICYFVATLQDRCAILRGHFPTGEIQTLTMEKIAILDCKRQGEYLYAITMDPCGNQNLARLWLPSGRLELLTHHQNTWTDAPLPVEELRYLTKDGIEIAGWIMRPRECGSGHTYPCVLAIHGGPNMAYGPGFNYDFQYLAERGYGILFCNPRGSAGRGGDFADIRGRYGDVDYTDVMGFCDAAIQRYPWIDSARMGVMGASYGGFLTNWIIGQTTRFRAAVSERSEANVISQYLLSEIGYSWMYDVYRVTPWENPRMLWEASPLAYAPNVTTPALLIQAEQDTICPATEAMQYFAALKLLGKQVRLALFYGENHMLNLSGRPSSRRRRIELITAWFHEYL